MSEHQPQPERRINEAQEASLTALCSRYNVNYSPDHYHHTFDLPEGYVAGWIGGLAVQETHPTIYAGCDPEGRISS